MTVNGTSIEEDFEIIKFFEDIAPFTMLIGKPWIDRDQARRKDRRRNFGTEEARPKRLYDQKDRVVD
jgi:hypothetical protein